MGKTLTFGGFVLALLCLVPAALFTLAGSGDTLPEAAGLVAILGFPLFAIVSFVGMILWTVAALRRGGGAG